MGTAHDTIVTQLNERKIKAITDDDYTIADMGVDSGYQYNVFTFDSLTVNRVLTLPTLADNQGYVFEVVNLDGSYDIEITPEGAEDINDWNDIFPVTEKYGVIRVEALSDRWLATPLNDACIYEVSSETADTGLTLDSTWDDVSGMTLLNGIYGKGWLSARINQYIVDSSLPDTLYSYFGIGKTSGNNAPDIDGGYDNTYKIRVTANNNYEMQHTKTIPKFLYESDGSTIYMKAKAQSDEPNITAHYGYGETNAPMYIRFIRKY